MAQVATKEGLVVGMIPENLSAVEHKEEENVAEAEKQKRTSRKIKE